MKQYILVAFRLVGSEVLVPNEGIVVKASNSGDDVVVTFTREPSTPQKGGKEITALLARVTFTQTDIRVDPRSLVLNGGMKNNDYMLQRVALASLSQVLRSGDEFDLTILSPDAIKGGQRYGVLVAFAPYLPGGSADGEVISRSGKLTYVPSPILPH